jgi:hypothetical protein
MSRYNWVAWRAIAFAAFAGTAALAVVLTRPAVLTRPPPDSVSAAAACRSAGLAAWLGVGGGSPVAGDVTGKSRVGEASLVRDVYYALEFTNVSDQPCILYGYPHVWAYAGGHLIGSQAMADPSVRPSRVTLAPDATAHAVLALSVTDATTCREVTVPDLRVTPPESNGAMLVPGSIPACSRAGINFLSVQAVQPRAGIPGFNRY